MPKNVCMFCKNSHLKYRYTHSNERLIFCSQQCLECYAEFESKSNHSMQIGASLVSRRPVVNLFHLKMPETKDIPPSNSRIEKMNHISEKMDILIKELQKEHAKCESYNEEKSTNDFYHASENKNTSSHSEYKVFEGKKLFEATKTLLSDGRIFLESIREVIEEQREGTNDFREIMSTYEATTKYLLGDVFKIPKKKSEYRTSESTKKNLENSFFDLIFEKNDTKNGYKTNIESISSRVFRGCVNGEYDEFIESLKENPLLSKYMSKGLGAESENIGAEKSNPKNPGLFSLIGSCIGNLAIRCILWICRLGKSNLKNILMGIWGNFVNDSMETQKKRNVSLAEELELEPWKLHMLKTNPELFYKIRDKKVHTTIHDEFMEDLKNLTDEQQKKLGIDMHDYDKVMEFKAAETILGITKSDSLKLAVSIGYILAFGAAVSFGAFVANEYAKTESLYQDVKLRNEMLKEVKEDLGHVLVDTKGSMSPGDIKVMGEMIDSCDSLSQANREYLDSLKNSLEINDNPNDSTLYDNIKILFANSFERNEYDKYDLSVTEDRLMSTIDFLVLHGENEAHQRMKSLYLDSIEEFGGHLSKEERDRAEKTNFTKYLDSMETYWENLKPLHLKLATLEIQLEKMKNLNDMATWDEKFTDAFIYYIGRDGSSVRDSIAFLKRITGIDNVIHFIENSNVVLKYSQIPDYTRKLLTSMFWGGNVSFDISDMLNLQGMISHLFLLKSISLLKSTVPVVYSAFKNFFKSIRWITITVIHHYHVWRINGLEHEHLQETKDLFHRSFRMQKFFINFGFGNAFRYLSGDVYRMISDYINIGKEKLKQGVRLLLPSFLIKIWKMFFSITKKIGKLFTGVFKKTSRNYLFYTLIVCLVSYVSLSTEIGLSVSSFTFSVASDIIGYIFAHATRRLLPLGNAWTLQFALGIISCTVCSSAKRRELGGFSKDSWFLKDCASLSASASTQNIWTKSYNIQILSYCLFPYMSGYDFFSPLTLLTSAKSGNLYIFPTWDTTATTPYDRDNVWKFWDWIANYIQHMSGYVSNA